MSAEHTFAENTQKTFQITTEDDKNRTMKPSSLFFIWFAANLTIGDFAIGFIPISLGMPVDYAVVALIIGNITGGMLMGMMSMTGALTGKPQMALSLGPFGQLGSRVLAVLQWGNTLGWLTVNLVLASFALHANRGVSAHVSGKGRGWIGDVGMRRYCHGHPDYFNPERGYCSPGKCETE